MVHCSVLSFTPLYNHPNGYKLQLSATLVKNCPSCVMEYVQSSSMPNGAKLSTGVLVEIQLVDGENDHELKWPFKKQINVTRLNKTADNCHCKIEVSCEGNRKEFLRFKRTVDKCLQQQHEEIVDDSKLLKKQFDELCQASSGLQPAQVDLDKMHLDLYQKFHEMTKPNFLLFPYKDEVPTLFDVSPKSDSVTTVFTKIKRSLVSKVKNFILR